MFREILRTQWKWAWSVVLFCAVGAFALPLLSIQGTMTEEPGTQLAIYGVSDAQIFVTTMERWAPLYTLLAAGLGLALAVLAWSADHRGRHVYALSLPVERWRFVLLRFGGGNCASDRFNDRCGSGNRT
jgi:hypothetical protein